MRHLRLIPALLLATPLGSLGGTLLLLLLEAGQWQRPAGAFYSTGEILIFAGVLMTIVSLFVVCIGLLTVALPLTILLHPLRISPALADLIVTAGLCAAGMTVSLGFASASPLGAVYGICAGIAWAAMLRLLKVRSVPAT